MTNDAQHDVHPEDLALYALGALDDQELVRIRKHLDTCAACRLELQKLNADAGAFALAAAPSSAPPLRVKERLMREISRDVAPAPSPRVGKWSLAFRFVVAAILLAAVLLEWRDIASLRSQNADLKAQLQDEQKSSAQARAIAETIMAPDAMRLTLIASDAKPQPSAHVVCSTKRARVFLMASHLAPLGPGKMYELWLLPKSGAPVPAGMFQSDADWNAQMLHSGLPSGMEAKGFAVTIEPEQGSLAPTGKPVLMGTVS